MRYLAVVLFLIISLTANADLSDCKDLYVGTLGVSKEGLTHVVFKTHPDNVSGSYAVFFSNWTRDEKKEVLSVLLAAKLSSQKINVSTELSEGNQCGITGAGRELLSVQLTGN